MVLNSTNFVFVIKNVFGNRIFSKYRMPSVMLLKIVKQDLQDKESFDGSPSARQFDVQ